MKPPLSWRFILRVIAVISCLVSIAWIIREPHDFNPWLALIAGMGMFAGSFIVSGKPIIIAQISEEQTRARDKLNRATMLRLLKNSALPFLLLLLIGLFMHIHLSAARSDMELIWRDSPRIHTAEKDEFELNFTLLNKRDDHIYLNGIAFALQQVMEAAMPPPFAALKVSRFNDQINATMTIEGGKPQLEALTKSDQNITGLKGGSRVPIFMDERIRFDPKEAVDFRLRVVVDRPPDDELAKTNGLQMNFLILVSFEDVDADQRRITLHGNLLIGPQWNKELTPVCMIRYR